MSGAEIEVLGRVGGMAEGEAPAVVEQDRLPPGLGGGGDGPADGGDGQAQEQRTDGSEAADRMHRDLLGSVPKHSGTRGESSISEKSGKPAAAGQNVKETPRLKFILLAPNPVPHVSASFQSSPPGCDTMRISM